MIVKNKKNKQRYTILLLVFGFIGIFKIQAQKPTTNIYLEKHLKRQVKAHVSMVATNIAQSVFASHLSANAEAVRHNLDFDNYQAIHLGQNILDGFIDASLRYVQSKYNNSLTTFANYSFGRNRKARNAFTLRNVTDKIEKERKYMSGLSRWKFITRPGLPAKYLELSHGGRFLLVLDSFEKTMKLSLRTVDY